MDNGLIIENIETGQGSEAKEYNKIRNYIGKLEDGSIFDSSLKGRILHIYSWRRLCQGWI